ncbi:MAG: flagellar hook-basal body complex protein [Rhodospirillales bacterium]|nr:flagellar hook-basal body complex protein [Rhodospirillales bacterium]
MSIYSAFSTPVLAMMSQSHSMDVIGGNIANVNTGGYKSTDVRFSTVLSDSLFNQSDLGGAKPLDVQNITTQGVILPSQRDMDISVNGQGFFVLNTAVDGSGDTLYTRDGSFLMGLGDEFTTTGLGGETITAYEGYLVDKNGYYVQGWEPDNQGNFSNTGTLTSIRVDPFAFSDSGQETTNADLSLNLPANDATGTVRVYNVKMYDNTGELKSPILNFTKDSNLNEWTISVTTDNVGDTVTSPAQTLTFGSDGYINTPTSYTVSVTWADGNTSSVSIDISLLTQFSGNFTPLNYNQNGLGTGNMKNISFASDGRIIANFENSMIQNIYKLPLAVFTNANGLSTKNGNVFFESSESGSATLKAAGEGSYGSIAPFSREVANVDMAEEFTKMIMTQTAYNSSSTVFRTIDEMTITARDLKR